MNLHEARYYNTEPDSAVRCLLCPHRCLMREGNAGLCRSRVNRAGKLYTLAYGHPCALADDPIEKKPLLHFHPGSRCLSLACTGCNLRCLNCQNFEISQVAPGDVPSMEYQPQEVVDLALQAHLPSIAYTYTEPLTYIEYVHDIALLAHARGLGNVLVSAGYVNPDPLRWLVPFLDAANIDLKVFDDDLYRKWNGATLAPVLETLKILLAAGVHLEITNLLIPEFNTDPRLLQQMCTWLVENGFAACPLHFSRCFPMYKMPHIAPTPKKDLVLARDIALQSGMKWVHLGNI